MRLVRDPHNDPLAHVVIFASKVRDETRAVIRRIV
jgi:hypothetical protein